MNSVDLPLDGFTLDTNRDGSIAVMPLGDSITRGEDAATPINLQSGYRDDLLQQLTDADISVDFVGSLSSGEGFDTDHEGHGGKTIDFISDNIGQWLEANPPEVVLLKAGTNDMGFFGDRTPESAIAQLGTLIDQISNQSPDTPILISSIVPANPTRLANSIYARSILPDFSDRVASFNALLPELVSQKVSQGKPVSFVDGGGQLSATTDLSTDGLHPNSAGYEKLAGAYFNEIKRLLEGELAPPMMDNPRSLRIAGTAGDDRLLGQAGDDVLYGLDGADSIDGGIGDDTLYGAADRDRLDGGNGDDYLDGGSEDDRLNGGNGNDLLVGRTGNDLLEGRNGDDTLSGGEGSDKLNGGSGNDVLNGGEGNDFFKGGSGQDRLYGVGGNDFLEGGSNNDFLLGGGGDDTLKGTEEEAVTAQIDILDGGPGRNLFIVQTVSQAAYTRAASNDYALIRSFDPNSDRIALGSSTYRLESTDNRASLFDSRNELIAIIETDRASSLDIDNSEIFIKNYAV